MDYIEKEMERRVAPSNDFVVPFCAMNVDVIKSYEDEVASVFSELDKLDDLIIEYNHGNN